MTDTVAVCVRVNGTKYVRDVPPRMTVADFLRDVLGLTGTHLGCEHGVCGACTILVDGRSARSCIMYVPQLEQADVRTVEGLQDPSGRLHPLQEAFRDCHGLQCGFCTAGILLTAYEYLTEETAPSDQDIRAVLSGNICRCTGYESIVSAIQQADRTWDRPVGFAARRSDRTDPPVHF